MDWITEKDYENLIQTRVLPDLAERKGSGFLERGPGEKLYYERYYADDPGGCVVLLHGYSEGIGKWTETIWYLLQSGYHVWVLQQREHGKSFRATADPDLIHITDYRELPEDVHAFVTKKVAADEKSRDLPRIIFGHSMGGGVSACCLERYPQDFEKAILSAPMLEMKSGDVPLWQAEAYVRLMLTLRRGENYLPGSAPFDGKPDFEGSCTHSRARYDWWFKETAGDRENQMCVSSVRTAMELLKLTREVQAPKNTARVRARVLLFQAGEDTMVGNDGQNRWAARLGDRARLVRYEHARHEIYRETDDILREYWGQILFFLQS